MSPTAYEMVEQSQLPGARLRNVIIGARGWPGRGVSGTLPVESLGGAKRARNGRPPSTTPVGDGHTGCAHDHCVAGLKGRTTCQTRDYPTCFTGGDADLAGRRSHHCRRPVGRRDGRARTKASSQTCGREDCRSTGMTTRWETCCSRDAHQADARTRASVRCGILAADDHGRGGGSDAGEERVLGGAYHEVLMRHERERLGAQGLGNRLLRRLRPIPGLFNTKRTTGRMRTI